MSALLARTAAGAEASTSTSRARAFAHASAAAPCRPSVRPSPGLGAFPDTPTGSGGLRRCSWRPPARRGNGSAGGKGALLQPTPPSAQPGGKGADSPKKKKKRAGGTGYKGPSPRQLVRRAGIQGRAAVKRALAAAAGWPGIAHALAALAAADAATRPARDAAAAAWDALSIDYGAFLASETRRVWTWAAEHPVEAAVAKEHVRWVRTFALSAVWAWFAPPTIAWTLGVPSLLLSAPWGVRGQVRSPVLWAVLFVCQVCGKWPVSAPLMPLV